MNIWMRFRQRLADIRTLSQLGQDADRLSKQMHDSLTGAEHYVLASIRMADATAVRAFREIGAKPEHFEQAIAEQYRVALVDIGITAPEFDAGNESEPGVDPPVRFNAKADVNALFRLMKEAGERTPDKPLLGAQVIIAAVQLKHGVVPRAFDAMNIDRVQLGESACRVIDGWRR